MLRRSSYRVHSLSHKLAEARRSPLKSFTPPVVVGICGGSGSGKTTFARELAHLLGESVVAHLNQDDYYRDLGHLSAQERAVVNFDHPDSIEFDLLETHLDHLAVGLEVAVPTYDFSSHTRVGIRHVVLPKPIIIVEGILLFVQKRVLNRMNHKIFVDTKEDVRFARRLKRDVSERGRTPESVRAQFAATVLPMHNIFVEPSRAAADVVVSGEVPFDGAIAQLCYDIFHELSRKS